MPSGFCLSSPLWVLSPSLPPSLNLSTQSVSICNPRVFLFKGNLATDRSEIHLSNAREKENSSSSPHLKYLKEGHDIGGLAQVTNPPFEPIPGQENGGNCTDWSYLVSWRKSMDLFSWKRVAHLWLLVKSLS